MGQTFWRVSANVALTLASLGVFLLVLEVAVRIYERVQRHDESWAVYDPDLGYRPRPNYADFNSEGLRDDPLDLTSTRFRILFLGDSVPFYGESIADTYVGRLEAALNSDPRRIPTEVLNAGVRGYTNYQEIVYLKKFGLAFDPDVVGIGFVLNDLHRFLHRFAVVDGRIVGEYMVTEEVARRTGNRTFQILRRSHLFRHVRQRLRILNGLLGLRASGGFSFEARADFSPAWRTESWRAIDRQLREFAMLAERHDFEPFLVAFPLAEQLRADYLARDSVYVLMPQRMLADICRENRIPYLDLRPILTRGDFDVDNIHLSASGRQHAAVATANFLERQHLIPAAAVRSTP